MQPLGNKVLVILNPRTDIEYRGIYVDEAKNILNYSGIVVGMGEYVDLVEIEDSVLIKNNCGTHLIVDSIDYLVVEEDEILLKLDKE